MSNSEFLLNKFQFCEKIPNYIKYKIKLFHCNGQSVWFVTNDDRVYTLGYNWKGILGLGHNNNNNNNSDVNEPQVIPELCQKNVSKFSIGIDFALCMTSDQHIYSWGSNDWKQLGRHTISDDECNKPAIINLKCITDIMCGDYHTLALTNAGTVYGWGDNNEGQCGCCRQQTDCIDSPTRIIFPGNTSIKSIYSYNCCSFAITTNDGLVYSWGQNRDNQLGHKNIDNYSTPKLIDGLINIKSISHNYDYNDIKLTYFLTNDGYVYQCGSADDIAYDMPIKLNVLSVDNIIGTGGFGKVYKVDDRETNELFAVKQITLEYKNTKDFNIIKEINQLLKLQSKFVVKCYYAWFESNIFYIQMELSSHSLKKLIEIKSNLFQRQSNEPMNCIEVYITSHLMFELCECVEYLHTRQPPVIHRDLKPANILINDKPIGNRFLKLCDFGLTTDHWRTDTQSESHTSRIGSQRYTSPEAYSGQYNEKRDIYSLGIICQELFDLHLNHLMLELCECVEYLHTRQPPVIHRDLKPANILINDKPIGNRFLKLCDFGLTTDHRRTDTQSESHTSKLGTNKYMPFEAYSENYNEKRDIYSLDIIGHY
ncbi:uncharacterized protein LOC128957105 [Oppia nitens]|uniref:uncharacterized protein LOC128957105 n=1 Tax=Oppia nitens TaxID=1686743 RepID=UPI0023DACF33|nr:uncharacterized protein LOC128957105 [Oppia nitens]